MPYTGNPGNSPADEVRFLLGDTADPPRLTDPEIAWLLETYGSPLQAAYNGALRLVSKYGGRTSKTVGPTSIDYGSLVDQYNGIIRMLERMGAGHHNPIPTAGGLDDDLWSEIDWAPPGAPGDQ